MSKDKYRNTLLVTSAAPKKSPFSTVEKSPPLGVGSIISVLREAGHPTYFIDNYLRPTDFIKDGFLQKNQIDIVGIYANTICYSDTLRMFKEIQGLRERGDWRGFIVVGGPHTSVAPETIPRFVDFVVQGEGERAMLDIVNGNIKDRIIRAPRMHELDSLPFQPWDIFSELPYDFSCPWMDIDAVYTMNTSRGCPFDCTFCSVESVWGRRYTRFSADRIISELMFLIENYGARGIYFREDNFTLDKERTEEFCTKLIDRKIDICWACETRVDNLSESMVKLMARSGCRALYLGIESGSQRMLDVLNKGITINQIEKVIEWSKRYNIRSYCSFIVGVPGERFRDYIKTRRLLRKLKPFSFSYNIFVGIPTSPLYSQVKENKLYETIDEVGILYPVGYHVKTRFFMGKDSGEFIDYPFKQKGFYDRLLLLAQFFRKIKQKLKIIFRFEVK